MLNSFYALMMICLFNDVSLNPGPTVLQSANLPTIRGFKIKKPTRIIEHSSTVIDLFFVNNSHRVVDSGVVPLTISDLSVRWVRKGKSGPLERAELANQIQGFRIPVR